MKKDWKPEIVWLDPKELTPYINNSKIHSDEQIDHLAGSIAEFGFNQPILVDKDKVIVAGHGRREAALRLNMSSVPVVFADHLDENQIKASRIADNKLASLEYDKDKLAFDIGTLDRAGFDLNLTGIGFDEIKDLLTIGELGSEGSGTTEENPYTNKIQIPIYEPSNIKPKIEELYDFKKTKELLDQIESSDIPGIEKVFLRFAAQRHIVFNYSKIADYYAHSDEKVKDLFERSALVIIDFNKAIENEFVILTEKIAEAYKIEKETRGDENEID